MNEPVRTMNTKDQCKYLQKISDSSCVQGNLRNTQNLTVFKKGINQIMGKIYDRHFTEELIQMENT